MINPNMREYNYYLYGTTNEYGQQTVSTEPNGVVKMYITLYNNAATDSIMFRDVEYIGLTHAEVNDAYVIEYEKERLKVLYVNKHGRLNQVYMKRI